MSQFCIQARRGFSTGVYLWKPPSTLAIKSGNAKERLSLPTMPKRIESFDDLNVKKLIVGNRHSAVISEDGMLYTFGSGNWGVLGHGTEKDVSFQTPKHVEALGKSNMKVKDFAAGEYHSIALGEDGSVWTWGYGGKKGMFSWMFTQEVGALGHGDIAPYFTPKRVSFFAENGLKALSIAAGNYHSVALCNDGNLYTWGVGLYGVLGNGSNAYALKPQIVEEFKFLKEQAKQDGLEFGFTKICAADDYTAVVLNDGQLLVWGKNDRGQMGVGSGIGIDMVESETTPQTVDFRQALPEKDKDDPVIITDVATGSRTMMAKDSKGRVYKTGLKIDYTPKLINFNKERMHKVKSLACGMRYYAVLDDENNIHCFGKIFKDKSSEQYDGFQIFDGEEIFDQGKILDLQMKYEVLGALIGDYKQLN